MTAPRTHFPINDTNQLRRISERGHYDTDTVFNIIDQCRIAHVGFVDNERPIVIPMTCARDRDTLIIHGANKGRITETTQGMPVCLTFTLTDALVYARSIFHSSMNYRSAVVHGLATAITDPEEKLAALHSMSERLMPGRWAEVRAPLEKELKATKVMRVHIEYASAKIRNMGVMDDESDYTPEQWSSTWAGVLPIASGFGQPLTDAHTPSTIQVTASVMRLARST